MENTKFLYCFEAKFRAVKWFHEIFFNWYKIFRFFTPPIVHCTVQCGNYENSLSVLLNKLLKSWFDEKKFWWERISRFSTVCTVCGMEITEIYSHCNLFWQKFRESNTFTNEIVDMTKFLSGESKFLYFPQHYDPEIFKMWS